MIHRERLTANLDGDFVVFLIGMRLNQPWKVHKWTPLASAMPRMIAELRRLDSQVALTCARLSDGAVAFEHERTAVERRRDARALGTSGHVVHRRLFPRRVNVRVTRLARGGTRVVATQNVAGYPSGRI